MDEGSFQDRIAGTFQKDVIRSSNPRRSEGSEFRIKNAQRIGVYFILGKSTMEQPPATVPI